jgi:hypothetical protein
MESEWSTKTKRKQRKKGGKHQVTAAEEQHQAEAVAAVRKRALSQRSIEVVKSFEVSRALFIRAITGCRPK